MSAGPRSCPWRHAGNRPINPFVGAQGEDGVRWALRQPPIGRDLALSPRSGPSSSSGYPLRPNKTSVTPLTGIRLSRMFHRTPCFSAGAPLQGRTCVSDTINDGPATAATGADTAANANGNGSAPRRRSAGGLAGKLLPELQQIAGDLGITGTARMRKSELIAAIQERQGGGPARSGSAQGAPPSHRSRAAQRGGSAEKPAGDEPSGAGEPQG